MSATRTNICSHATRLDSAPAGHQRHAQASSYVRAGAVADAQAHHCEPSGIALPVGGESEPARETGVGQEAGEHLPLMIPGPAAPLTVVERDVAPKESRARRQRRAL